MLNDAIGFDKIFIACGYTDLRFSIEGLAAIISKTYSVGGVLTESKDFSGKGTDSSFSTRDLKTESSSGQELNRK